MLVLLTILLLVNGEDVLLVDGIKELDGVNEYELGEIFVNS